MSQLNKERNNDSFSPLDQSKMTKEERKEYVKRSRELFRKDPQNFVVERVIKPTVTYWKTEPLHALYTFGKWVAIYYIMFAMFQAVNNDMIYCDCTLDQFDGKIMYTHNEFVKYYNEEIVNMRQNYVPTSFEDEKNISEGFYNEYKMYCDYDIARWNNESVGDRFSTIGYGFKKILLKRK